MLILLPPSEGKTGRSRGRRLDPARLSFPELGERRAEVAAALTALSAEPHAAQTLGVSPTLVADLARNRALLTSPALPALDCYSGVLYDALSYRSLSPAAQRRANRWVIIVSALFGAVRPKDPVVPYRLSMAVNLPGVGPLASAWKPLLGEVLPLAAGRGLVIDCRSSTYAAAWAPEGALAHRWIHIAVPGATHMAKHTRGLLTRALCTHGVDPRTPERLLDPVREAMGPLFTVELAEPAGRGRPWTLSVTPPAGPAAGIRVPA
ncbi:MAG: peroxide stress protein YaaA [Nostocoides sp.]